MTEGDDPLVCGCGAHSAVFVRGSKKKKVRDKWQVLAVQTQGHKPRPVTTAYTKQKALERVEAVCAASSQPKSASNVTQPAHTQLSTCHLRQQTAVNYDDSARVASKPAGPGRGHTGKRPADALEQAVTALKKPRASAEELRDALGKLTEQYKLLQRWYTKAATERNQAYALLSWNQAAVGWAG